MKEEKKSCEPRSARWIRLASTRTFLCGAIVVSTLLGLFTKHDWTLLIGVTLFAFGGYVCGWLDHEQKVKNSSGTP